MDRPDGNFDARLADLFPRLGRPIETRVVGPAGCLAGPFIDVPGSDGIGPHLPRGFDPFARPPGERAVRYRLGHRSGRGFGLDVLHRAAGRPGGPVLDLHHDHPRGRAGVRLRRMLAALGPAADGFEVWDGDPWGRWE